MRRYRQRANGNDESEKLRPARAALQLYVKHAIKSVEELMWEFENMRGREKVYDTIHFQRLNAVCHLD